MSTIIIIMLKILKLKVLVKHKKIKQLFQVILVGSNLKHQLKLKQKKVDLQKINLKR